jgi:hypothetical protein
VQQESKEVVAIGVEAGALSTTGVEVEVSNDNNNKAVDLLENYKDESNQSGNNKKNGNYRNQKKNNNKNKDKTAGQKDVGFEDKFLRTAGRLLGLSIRHNFPMGVALPPALWHEIMFNEYAPWKQYCLHDESYRNGLEKLLQMDEHELAALDMRFVVTETISSTSTSSTNNSPSKKRQFQNKRNKNNLQKNDTSEEVAGDTAAEKVEKVESAVVETSTIPVKTSDAVKSQLPSTNSVDVELISGGKDILVKTNKDALKFVQLAARRRLLGGCDVSNLRAGFQDVIPRHLITSFGADEFSELIAGPNYVDVAQWKRCCIYGDDITANDPLIKMFWSCVQDDLSEEERRSLLLFWSGSSVAPVFGHPGSSADGLLDEDENFCINLLHKSEITKGQVNVWCPEAATCSKTLSIPRYTNKKAMLAALRVALKHGSVGYDRT